MNPAEDNAAFGRALDLAASENGYMHQLKSCYIVRAWDRLWIVTPDEVREVPLP